MALQPPISAIFSSGGSAKLPSSTPSSSHRLPTVSAAQQLEEAETTTIRNLATGLPSLDDKLGTGLEKGKVHELWGPSGSGKTALALQVAVGVVQQRQDVIWVDCSSTLSGLRLNGLLDVIASSTKSGSLKAFRHRHAPTLSHLLALVLYPPPGFPAQGTALLVIDDIATLVDLAYPRSYSGANKTEAQRWQQNRRYAVLGSLISGLNKLAVFRDLAVIVTTGCATRIRQGSGMGAVLVPGIGGQEWDNGIWTRVVCFRDFNGRFIGVTKAQRMSLAIEEGVVGKVVSFVMTGRGALHEISPSAADSAAPIVVISPAKARKRPFDEIADSDGEDADEFGWADDDREAAEGLMVGSETVDLTEDGGCGVG